MYICTYMQKIILSTGSLYYAYCLLLILATLLMKRGICSHAVVLSCYEFVFSYSTMNTVQKLSYVSTFHICVPAFLRFDQELDIFNKFIKLPG